jgi:hypothetical protein
VNLDSELISINLKQNSVSCFFFDMEMERTETLKRKKLSSNVPNTWTSEFHWLLTEGDLMICVICREAKSEKNDWAHGVLYSEYFRKTRLYEHSESKKHLDAVGRAVEITRALQIFSGKPKLSDSEMMIKYRNVFRNIYFIARNDLPLNLIEGLHAHVASLNVPLPANHLSRRSGCEIIDVIGEYFRGHVISQLKKAKYFSIMLDETTDNSTTKQLIIYVRYVFEDIAQTKFLTIISLKDFTALGIYAAVGNFFKPHNLFYKILFICTDGAPVMRSTGEGLAGLIIKDNPYAKSFHCIAHRFSLGINSSVNSSKYLNKVLNFVSNCYSYLYASPKRVLLLFKCQKSIEEYTLNLIKPLKIRWLSFLRAASRICDVYKSVYSALKELSKDDAHAKGLKITMEKLHILLWIHVLADVLPSLNFVLSNLEKEDIDIALVQTSIQTATDNLEKSFMGDINQSERYKNVRNHIDEYFEKQKPVYDVISVTLPKKNASLEENFKLFEIEFKLFVQEMIKNLRDLEENLEFANHFKILGPANIRKDSSLNDAMYGMSDLKILFEFYTYKPYSHLPITLMDADLFEEWKLYKSCVSKMSPELKREEVWSSIFRSLRTSLPNLIDLIELNMIIPLSTVECERGFSKMSLIKTDLRSCLSEFRLDSLLHISLNGTENIELVVDDLIVEWENKKKRVIH